MEDVFWHRMQFAFTITFHYLFPQLTMGLALLIAIMKTLGLRPGGDRWNDAARFWIRIFGINFAMGVATGIPMEFQFGTNWAAFSRFAGNVVGHTLAMEGLFAFFLESSFLAVLVWGERRAGRWGHWLAALALFLGSWLSGYFIVATNAFLQHPVGHAIGPDGTLQLASFWAFVLNPWAVAQYAHTMVGSVVTAAFVVAAGGAFYALRQEHQGPARRFLKTGVITGLVASVLAAFPTGDYQAKLVARWQPVSLAAMEGRFESGPQAAITLIGQPNVPERRLDNPVRVRGVLSLLAFGTFHADVPGLPIRAETNGEHSLDDVMVALYNETKDWKPGYQEGRIRELAVQFGGAALGPGGDRPVQIEPRDAGDRGVDAKLLVAAEMVAAVDHDPARAEPLRRVEVSDARDLASARGSLEEHLRRRGEESACVLREERLRVGLRRARIFEGVILERADHALARHDLRHGEVERSGDLRPHRPYTLENGAPCLDEVALLRQ